MRSTSRRSGSLERACGTDRTDRRACRPSGTGSPTMPIRRRQEPVRPDAIVHHGPPAEAGRKGRGEPQVAEDAERLAAARDLEERADGGEPHPLRPGERPQAERSTLPEGSAAAKAMEVPGGTRRSGPVRSDVRKVLRGLSGRLLHLRTRPRLSERREPRTAAGAAGSTTSRATSAMTGRSASCSSTMHRTANSTGCGTSST